MQAHLTVENLCIAAKRGQGDLTAIVKQVSFSLARGEVLALIGESGSGKTTIALALLGYTRAGCQFTAGRIQLGEQDILALSAAQLARLRGNKVAYVAQSAAAAFNPARRIMEQVIESALIHGTLNRQQAQQKAIVLFRQLSLPAPETLGNRYPHEVSGGQLQRLMAAMALICDPELVIFDEPTTALDVTTQVDVLRAFKKAVKATNTTAVYVSHDLAVVAQMADRIIVLQQGEVVENNSTNAILTTPAQAYTRQLLAAVKTSNEVKAPYAADTVLEINGIVAGYGAIQASGLPKTPILKNISLQVRSGQTIGIIGESGSGKSTLARVIAGLLPAVQGTMQLNGQPLAPALTDRTKQACQQVQLVFQNADTALNPAHTVAEILGRPLTFFHGLRGAAKRDRIAELLSLVQLPAELAERRCGALSGGQKQRINLARALAAEPSVILCDEVTSALDTVVAAAILALLKELQQRLGIALVFISHDISTVKQLCNEIVVLYKGTQVEYSSGSAFASLPRHPYTEMLIRSVPTLNPGWLETTAPQRIEADGSVLANDNLCRFYDRCALRINGVCDTQTVPFRQIATDKTLLCHLELAAS